MSDASAAERQMHLRPSESPHRDCNEAFSSDVMLVREQQAVIEMQKALDVSDQCPNKSSAWSESGVHAYVACQ